MVLVRYILRGCTWKTFSELINLQFTRIFIKFWFSFTSNCRRFHWWIWSISFRKLWKLHLRRWKNYFWFGKCYKIIRKWWRIKCYLSLVIIIWIDINNSRCDLIMWCYFIKFGKTCWCNKNSKFPYCYHLSCR